MKALIAETELSHRFAPQHLLARRSIVPSLGDRDFEGQLRTCSGRQQKERPTGGSSGLRFSQNRRPRSNRVLHLIR
jgi:hypothetical protein